jgi:hypothetical protein
LTIKPKLSIFTYVKGNNKQQEVNMVITDFYTTYNKSNFILDVSYIINYASKVGRIAKKFADRKFSSAFVRDYVACYGFDTIEKANECKKALDEAFAGVKGVEIGNVRDRYMEKVQKEIEKIESEPVV